MKTPSLITGFPCFEQSSGSELCYLSFRGKAGLPQHLFGCNLSGGLFASDTYGGWEVWRITTSSSSSNNDNDSSQKDEEGPIFVKITSWTHKNKILCSDETGKVFTKTMISATTSPQNQDEMASQEAEQETDNEDEDNDDSLWKIEHAGEDGLWIRSVAHDRLLVLVENNNNNNSKNDTKQRITVTPTTVSTISAGKSSQRLFCWHAEPAHRNNFRICTTADTQDETKTTANATTKWLDKQDDKQKGPRVALTEKPHKAPVWKIEFVEPGYVRLQVKKDDSSKDDHGFYCVSYHRQSSSIVLLTTADLDDDEESFVWKIGKANDRDANAFVLSQEGPVFLAHQNGEIVALDLSDSNTSGEENGKESLAMNAADATTMWKLEPYLPNSLSSQQVWKRGAIVAAGVASAIVAPWAVTSAICMLGFGAEGIAAGSVAAGMMSAEAIASGGGVMAGGTVATLQSIGVLGLGTGATLAVGGTGAALGTGVVAAVASRNNGTASDQAGGTASDAEHAGAVLPLALWRDW